MINRTPDFIATLKYKTTEDGGLKNPVKSGCRPQVKFAFSEKQTSGQQKFINKEIVYPGETILAEITMLSPDFFKNCLYVGLDFEIRAGSTIIGTGIITKILNEQLPK